MTPALEEALMGQAVYFLSCFEMSVQWFFSCTPDRQLTADMNENRGKRRRRRPYYQSSRKRPARRSRVTDIFLDRTPVNECDLRALRLTLFSDFVLVMF